VRFFKTKIKRFFSLLSAVRKHQASTRRKKGKSDGTFSLKKRWEEEGEEEEE